MAAAKCELCRREALMPEIAQLDGDVAHAAIEAFEAPRGATEWLIRAAHALGGDVPIEVLRRTDGREAVLQALCCIKFNILT